MNEDNGIGIKEAQSFLTKYYPTNTQKLAVTLLGEGAWSRCFGYQHADQNLAIRFGNYVEDFEKDRQAFRHVADDLPIPQVLDIGQAYGGYYAISTRVYGEPLENAAAADWRDLVPSVVAMLEAIRTADLSDSQGYGGWDQHGNASAKSWSHDQLAIANDPPDPTDDRNSGWRAKLAQHPEGEETFLWGINLLKQTIPADVPRSLIHGDLINRNVFVEKHKISGIFDWGCSRYGDHLYDLAWFDFWAPWYPNLDITYLQSELEKEWLRVGYEPQNREARLLSCSLHIGLDHLAYNASTGDEKNLLATAQRMRTIAAAQ